MLKEWENVTSRFARASMSFNLESLNDKLARLEQIGLVSRRIFSKNDESVEAWKSNINSPVGSFRPRTLLKEAVHLSKKSTSILVSKH